MSRILKAITKNSSRVVTLARRILPKASISSVMWFSCVSLIVLLAVAVRVLPLQWGFTINEFDPFFNYEVTKHVVDNGFTSFINWHTDRAWYPFGRDIGTSSFPGLPFSGAVLYYLISALGFSVTVMDACIIFPVLMGAITCIVAYYFGKDVGGREVGLLSALFLALSPAYISRTVLGFYDTETVGIFGSLLAALFYLRSIDQTKKWQVSLGYAIASGLSLGLVFASWGAARYPLSLLALFTFILLIMKRYSRRLLASYGALMAVGLAIAASVPKLGLPYMKEFECIAAVGVFLLLLMMEITQRFKNYRERMTFVTIFLTLSALAVIVLGYFGFITLPYGKFLSVINPFIRSGSALIESVQEQRPATWDSFYYQFGVLVFLAPLGIMFVFQKLTNEKLFLTTFFITTLYFSASMIRLTIIMAPALCTLGALAMVEILRPFADIAIQRSFTRRRIRLSSRVGRGFSLIFMICLFAVTFLPLLKGIDSAYSPTTVIASSIPIRNSVSDWSEALVWMKDNTPKDAVVASWWDYGYWITVLGEKITLADNGTLNATQIAQIGRMFMSNETDALTILKRYNTSYVVLFSTIGAASGGSFLYGDEVKWRWMAKIGGLNDTALEDTSITSQLASYWEQNLQTSSSNYQQLYSWYQQFAQFAIPKSDTVFTKLMMYGAFKILAPTYFELVFASSGWGGQTAPMVFVYKVIYPS